MTHGKKIGYKRLRGMSVRELNNLKKQVIAEIKRRTDIKITKFGR